MAKELIFHVSKDEIASALLEDKQLVELNKEKKNVKFSVGDVYLARVKKIMPGLNAAFVDVGYEKDAFLHYHDLGPQFKSLERYIELIIKKGKKPSFQKFKGKGDIDKNGKINHVLKTGQRVFVQVTKEPIANKGPRLSAEVSIAGRNLVLLPFSDRVSVSQKIESGEERNRLKQLIKSIKPNNYGVIIRTVAKDKKVAELDNELRQLVQKWEDALFELRNIKPPKLVIGEIARTTAIIRDLLNMSFNHIYVDDVSVYNEVKDYINEIAPDRKKIVKHYTNKTPIFDHFDINKQIKALFGRTVYMKNGSYLIIEHTEALHSIDVNSGNRAGTSKDQESNAIDVNLTAAEEIARQLRLRDMGGIIVIDFIDMQKNDNKQKVFEKMKDVMKDDRTKHTILPLSKFGLMQITRQRVRPEMNIKTLEKCPTCKGKGEISPSILFVDEIDNKLEEYIKLYQLKKIVLKVHPFIEAYLKKGFSSVKRKWRKKYHCKIKVVAVSSFTLLEYKMEDIDGTKLNGQA